MTIRFLATAVLTAFMSAAWARPALVPMPRHVEWTRGDCPVDAQVTERTDASIPAEGYRLDITPSGVVIVSSGPAGAFYARKTLEQLREDYETRSVYRCCRIEDDPAYPWRGVLIDEGRHFLGKETVKRTIELMSQYKFNRLHWHLTEDQGWRLDVPGMPELAKYGAVRAESPRHGSKLRHLGSFRYESELNGQQYGPYCYARKDIEEIVAYAAERHVEIIPEIELPGHFMGALAAYPELACRPENISPRMAYSDWGISTNVLCVGNDASMRFLERVMDYVCEVFPSRVVHIGGDECPHVMWERCPKCQVRMKAEGLTTAAQLQGWITRQMAEYLAKKGRRIMGWDEILAGNVPLTAIGQSWRTQAKEGAGTDHVSAADGAKRGFDMVVSPHSECYYTYFSGLKEDPFQYSTDRATTLKKAYSFDPMTGIPESCRAHILGSEACAWGEYTWNEYDLDWKLWPRACAMAEILWTNPKTRDFEAFKDRVASHRRRLVARYVNAQPVEDVGPVPFPEFSAPRAVTGGPHDHLLANYFAINAWSPDNRYLLTLETDLKDRMPDGQPCTLGLVDLGDGNRFIPVTTTCCWNFQEAAMAHWLPWAKDTFVFNDVRDGRFCAVVMNWRTKEERHFPYPVSAVSEDGEWALSINYARLFITRPDYGYAGNGQNPRKGVVFPEDDGLWRVNLRTGEAKLIVSCADVKGMVPEVRNREGMSYLCHTVISKDCKRIYFLSRSVEQSFEGVKKFQGVKWETTAFTCNADGTGIRRCFPDGWASSHFNWKPNLSERDARTMVVTCKWLNRFYTHVEFTVGEEDYPRQIGGKAMDFDGHCIYSPDGRFVSGDGYWDKDFRRHWKIVRLSDQKIREIGEFYVPEPYRDIYCRCDLHPRWRPDGKQIGFNSVHEGTRQVYLMDVR